MPIPLPKMEEGYCAFIGAVAVGLTQWAAKKPVNSGIHNKIFSKYNYKISFNNIILNSICKPI